MIEILACTDVVEASGPSLANVYLAVFAGLSALFALLSCWVSYYNTKKLIESANENNLEIVKALKASAYDITYGAASGGGGGISNSDMPTGGDLKDIAKAIREKNKASDTWVISA